VSLLSYLLFASTDHLLLMMGFILSKIFFAASTVSRFILPNGTASVSVPIYLYSST
jgi:hypothetical protein